ncbi:hypothetical protein [Streptomyces scabiei]|uniref:hypothetical protein n=1 Tax=Streptomyces scabiei TaxID=1930 RepID=UPI00131B63A4|nr:hypothetical protein [Streptomyces scabiei]
MENEQVLQTLINKLIAKTGEGRLEWSHENNSDPWARQSDTPPSYTVSLTRGTISIWSVDGDDLHPFIFQIRGDRGQVVEQIETPRINVSDEREYSSFESSIKTLYQSARRNALNTDAVLRQMLEDLDGK